MKRPKENAPAANGRSNESQEGSSAADESQVIEFETESGKREIYTPHPLTKIIPPMSEKDRDTLEADMLKRDLRVPILRHGNLILDGVNRYEICAKWGIEPRFDDYDGDDNAKDILAEIVSRNVPRRHLTAKQRAAIAAGLANIEHGQVGGGHDRQKLENKHLVSEKEAAKLLNVSRSSVQAAKRAKRKAEPAEAASAKPRKGKPKKERSFEDATYKRWTTFIYGWPPKERKGVMQLIQERPAKLFDDQAWDVWKRWRLFLKRRPADEQGRIEKLVVEWCSPFTSPRSKPNNQTKGNNETNTNPARDR